MAVRVGETPRALVLAAVLLSLCAALTGCTASSSEGEAQSSPYVSVSAVPQEELDAITKENLDLQWESTLLSAPDAVRPAVKLVRYTTQDDWATTMESCMHDAGWMDVKAKSDGLESSVSNEQASAHALAMYTCTAKYPTDPMLMLPLTDERLSTLYDYFVDELKPCLEAEGYDVSEPPSRSQFIETYEVDGGWNVYDAVPAGGGQQSWDAINKKCPQAPEDF